MMAADPPLESVVHGLLLKVVLRSRLSSLNGDFLALTGVLGSSVSSSWVETEVEGVEAGRLGKFVL